MCVCTRVARRSGNVLYEWRRLDLLICCCRPRCNWLEHRRDKDFAWFLGCCWCSGPTGWTCTELSYLWKDRCRDAWRRVRVHLVEAEKEQNNLHVYYSQSYVYILYIAKESDILGYSPLMMTNKSETIFPELPLYLFYLYPVVGLVCMRYVLTFVCKESSIR